MASSNITEYCTCHGKKLSLLLLVTYETLFTMRRTTDGILQHHRILRLPRNVTFMTDPCHIWNVIYNARNNRCHPPTSPNTAPATQNDCPDWSSSHMKRYLQCAEQQMASSNITEYCACHAKWLSWLILLTYETLFTMRGTTDGILQHHRILRLPRKMTVMTDPPHIWNVIYNARNNRWHPPTSPSTAPATQNDCHDWSSSHMKRYLQLRGTTDGILQHHRILRLPRKMTVMTDPRHIWNVIYNARNNRWHPPTSPNTAPATQSDCHDWSLSHMKRYLQCAEQQVSSSNITEYCACHAKWLSWLILVTYETLFTMRGTTDGILQHHRILRLPRKMTLETFTKISRKQLKRHFQCGTDPSRIRGGSEQDPRMKPSVRNPPRNRGYFSRPPRPFCIEKYNISRSGYHSKFHRILRLPRKVTLELHQILRLPRKVTLIIDPLHTWNVIYNARSNKCHCPNSPNTAPAEQDPSRIREWNRQSATHLATKVTFHAHHDHFVLKNTTFRAPAIIPNFTEYCACHEKWHLNFTKYCACHEK